MLCYGRARDDRAGSPPDGVAGRSDTGHCRVPSQGRTGRESGRRHAPRGLESYSLIPRGWQEHSGARVHTAEPPRPAHILKPRPVLGEPREGDDTGHPRPSGNDVNGEFQMVPHGEADVPEPTSTPDPVDQRAAWSVEPPPVAIWDGLPDLCGGPESLPWCGECFTNRRRAQACPWGALTRVVVESPRHRPDDSGPPLRHDGTAHG